jgi:nitric oxide reductase NorD protein
MRPAAPATTQPNEAHPYGTLAHAVAGQAVQVIGSGPDADVWSDGHFIVVGSACDARRGLEAVVVHAALIGAASLTRDLMRPLLRHNGLRDRYLTIEGLRAVAGLRDLLPRSLAYMIRDDIASLSDSPAASMALARTHAAIPDHGLYLGVLRPRTILSQLRQQPSISAHHDPETDTDRNAAGTTRPPRAAPAPVPDQRPSDDAPFFAAGVTGTLTGRLWRALHGGTGRAGGQGPVGGSSASGSNAAVRRVSYTTRRRATADDQSAAQGSTKGFRYPEWDQRIDGYRPQWCTVRVEQPGASTGTLVADDLGLRRPLSRLSTGPRRRRRQRDGDDIDIDAAVDHQISALAARDADDACYIATNHDRRDLSVLILLDVSGSAAEPGAGQIRIHDHQLRAVAALAMTLHRLGDRVAVYAFNSHGRHHVRLTTLKTFTEHSERQLLTRLHSVHPSGYSRLGAAVRHGASIIEDTGATRRRLLIVVSDGLAFDHGYDLDHGARDARRALAEARNRGTAALCLTVGARRPAEDLRYVFGTAAHATVTHPDRLAPMITRLCRTALRHADVRRAR